MPTATRPPRPRNWTVHDTADGARVTFTGPHCRWVDTVTVDDADRTDVAAQLDLGVDLVVRTDSGAAVLLRPGDGARLAVALRGRDGRPVAVAVAATAGRAVNR